MKIKKNDTVLILTGDDKGKTGKVLFADPKANKVVVDGVNIQKKHKKARRAQETSEIVSQSGPINASNVMVVCPVCGKATRVGYKTEGDAKVRFCKKCGAVIGTQKDVKEAEKPVKKATKKAETAEKAEAPAEKKTAKKTTTTKKSTTTKKADGEKAPAKKSSTKKEA
ncbi:MAG: 50S ribosomal protein L24 [Clostridia bacterium]|nr:50S ribosomal protein L24 [Clostridia bacterium]